MKGSTNASHANEVNVYSKLQLVIFHNAAVSRTIGRSDQADRAGTRKELNENPHVAKMISYSLRMLFDWIIVQMCFAGDESKMHVITAKKTGRDEEPGSWDTTCTSKNSFTYFITYIFLCIAV